MAAATAGISPANRQSARLMLKRALEQNNPHLEEYAEQYLLRIACDIEGAALRRTDPPGALATYRNRVRTLASNIARNRDLQASLCRRDVDDACVCSLDPADLASAEEQGRRKLLREKHIRNVTRSAWAESSRTKHHPCPRCHSREDVAYAHVSGARDVRKAETWGGGLSADTEVVVRLACGQCGHEWKDDRVHLDEGPARAAAPAGAGPEGSL